MKINSVLQSSTHRYLTDYPIPAVLALLPLLLLAPSAGAQDYSVLYKFGQYGAVPMAGLVQGPDGMLYGSTAAGGNGYGYVFKLHPDGTGSAAFNLSFSSPNGLLLDRATLYGGQVSKINTDGTGYTFLDAVDSGLTAGPLVLSGSTLYGLSWDQNSPYRPDGGRVFKLATDGSGFTNLKTLTASDGAYGPSGGLVLIGSTLYGMTSWSGYNEPQFVAGGAVFKINTDGSGFAILKGFGGTSGTHPIGTLVTDGTVLYGVTQDNCGNVFRLNTDGSGFTVLTNLPYSLAFPTAGLALAGQTLFGVAQQGGGGPGIIFALTTDGQGLVLLKAFSGGSDGYSPQAPVLVSSNNLYGTTAFGGSASGTSGSGVLFRLSLQPLILMAPTNQSVGAFSNVHVLGQHLGCAAGALSMVL